MSNNTMRVIAGSVLALMLGACGGGGGDSSANSAAQAASPAGASDATASGDYIVSGTGTSPAISGVNGNVALIFMPASTTANSITGTTITAGSEPLSSQVQQSAYGGAFTSVGVPSLSIVLTKHSTIADLNGAGNYIAIGRWTAGSDSSGGNYTANQGAVYAVGNPLTLTQTSGTMTCVNVMATSPASATGSVAPGSLLSATATIDLSSRTLQNFAATVSIGSDSGATITKTSAALTGGSMGSGANLMVEPMGNDAAHPLVAVAYAGKLTNTGDVNGLVVLSCN
ncbi:hypothetical protein [Paraburkholderia sp.]|uniref:hypothetical protein n=1 Tax=Paraburkholderia sp. TaxID=1926495 RepID=UPI00286EDE3A|nr:hypothetical protein [Paraburkholderia sp.]